MTVGVEERTLTPSGGIRVDPCRHPCSSASALRARRVAMIATFAMLSASAACEREKREFNGTLSHVTARGVVVQNAQVQPGPASTDPDVRHRYDGDTAAIADGKRLAFQYNCIGCHFLGGGGIGPALADSEWVYGNEMENIVATIMEGRALGMPSFKGKVTMDQAWRIAAYVRSLAAAPPVNVPDTRIYTTELTQVSRVKEQIRLIPPLDTLPGAAPGKAPAAGVPNPPPPSIAMPGKLPTGSAAGTPPAVARGTAKGAPAP